jgi:predicted ATP-binding protein involved in virulence
VSLFREDASLAESVLWLQEVYLRRLEDKPGWAELEALVLRLLGNGLLPGDMAVRRVDSEGLWVSQGGVDLPLRDLSDGYRTVAALVLDIVRHMSRTYGDLALTETADGLALDYPGVVLIDEIDAHLHVSWQQNIGFWLKTRFPKIQFIVSTHSPFICQAADPRGLIRLPAPAEARSAEHVSDQLFLRIVNGTADEAALTELFGLDHTYSNHSDELRRRVAALESKIVRGQASRSEREEHEQLELQIPRSPLTSVDQVARLLKTDLSG